MTVFTGEAGRPGVRLQTERMEPRGRERDEFADIREGNNVNLIEIKAMTPS